MFKNTVSIIVASVLSLIGGAIAGCVYGKEKIVKDICDTAEDQGSYTVVYRRAGEKDKQRLLIELLE